MAISRAARTRSKTKKPQTVGLLAIGASGAWEVAIDQTTSGPDRWFAHIEGPSVSLYFQIPSLCLIDKTVQFLGRPNVSPHNGTIALGCDKQSRVDLVRDDESGDRYFFVIETKNGPEVRLTLSPDDLAHLADALRQAREDLDEDTANQSTK